MYRASEAAKATGKSKSTIIRALKKGKISGTKTDDGEWLIEPAELHRVFPAAPGDVVHDMADDTPRTTPDTLSETTEVRELRAKLEAKDELVRAHEETIGDLRDRLDTEGEERRKLTAMLTDMRAAPPAPEPPKGFFARVFG